MKAAEFEVVAEARRAAIGQLSFFNRMMAVKKAGSAGKKVAKCAAPAKKRNAKNK